MIRTAVRLALVAAALSASCAHAQVGVTLDAGTTGVGGHLVVPLGAQVAARFGAGYFGHTFQGSTENIDYDIDGKLRTVDALLDWFPAAGSGFRLSAGAVYDGNKFDVVGRPSAGRYLINGVSYAAADVGTLSGAIDYGKFAPYLGIGYGGAPAAARGWGFAADLGAYYQGKGDSRLNSIGCTATVLICQAIARNVAVEQTRLAEQVSDVPKVYPVLRVAVSYKF